MSRDRVTKKRLLAQDVAISLNQLLEVCPAHPIAATEIMRLPVHILEKFKAHFDYERRRANERAAVRQA